MYPRLQPYVFRLQPYLTMQLYGGTSTRKPSRCCRPLHLPSGAAAGSSACRLTSQPAGLLADRQPSPSRGCA